MGLGPERLGQALLKLGGEEPAVAGRLPKTLSDQFSVLIRGSDRGASRHLARRLAPGWDSGNLGAGLRRHFMRGPIIP